MVVQISVVMIKISKLNDLPTQRLNLSILYVPF